MPSIGSMLKQVEGLLDTKDLSEWEQEFVSSVSSRVAAAKGSTTVLSEKQVSIVERIYKKHFGG